MTNSMCNLAWLIVRVTVWLCDCNKHTLCIQTYSPNLLSKVPFCSDLSFSVNLGPTSCRPTLCAFLKMYLTRCKKDAKMPVRPSTQEMPFYIWSFKSPLNFDLILACNSNYYICIYTYALTLVKLCMRSAEVGWQAFCNHWHMISAGFTAPHLIV